MQTHTTVFTVPVKRSKEFLQLQFKVKDTEAEEIQSFPNHVRFRFSYDADDQLGHFVRICCEAHLPLGIEYL
jgi:hypothetical protein